MSTRAQLTLLESNGLIRILQVNPELSYLFRHTLVQEAAYQSLIRHDRRDLHLAVGKALEGLYPEPPEELIPVLAMHFDLGQDFIRAFGFYNTAAQAASFRYANGEAVMHYSRALELASQEALTAQITEQIWIELYLGLGYACQRQLDYAGALEAFLKLENKGHWGNNPAMEMAGILARCIIYSTPTPEFDSKLSLDLAERALVIARQTGDIASEARVYWLLMLQNYFINRVEAAREYGLRAIQIARQHNLREQLAYALNDIGSFVYGATGEFEQGRIVLAEAYQIFVEMNNLPMVSDNLISSSYCHYILGDMDSVQAAVQEGYRISEAIGNLWGQSFGLWVTGIYQIEALDIPLALASFQQSASISEQAGIRVGQILSNYGLSVLHSRLGASGQALLFAQLALAASESQSSQFRCYAYSAMASATILQEDWEATARFLERAFDVVDGVDGMLYSTCYPDAYCQFQLHANNFDAVIEFCQNFIMHPLWSLSKTYRITYDYYLGRAYQRLEMPAEALSSMTEAYRNANQNDLKAFSWRILAALGELAAAAGDVQTAKQYLSQAQDIVNTIAANLEDTPLHDPFLELLEVKILFSHLE